MAKYQLFIREKRKEAGREITVAYHQEKKEPCKQCKMEIRAPASSRCIKCSDSHTMAKLQNDRLQKKIKEQTL